MLVINLFLDFKNKSILSCKLEGIVYCKLIDYSNLVR